MARLACPFWARQACSFWARRKHMFPRKFRSIGTRIPVCPCKIFVQFQTHTRGPILYFSTCPSETILHPDIRSAGHCQCTRVGVQLASMHCLAHRLCETNALLTKHGRRCYVETNVPADNPCGACTASDNLPRTAETSGWKH